MKKKIKKEKLAKPSTIVLVSSFHSDEEEPWTYANRRLEGIFDIRSVIVSHAPMRTI